MHGRETKALLTVQAAETSRADIGCTRLNVELWGRGKTRATRCRPVVPFNDELVSDHFQYPDGDLGPTSDHLPRKIAHTVISLGRVLSQFKIQQFSKEFFHNIKNTLLINFSSSFRLFSINFSPHLEPLGYISSEYSPMLTVAISYSVIFFVNIM